MDFDYADYMLTDGRKGKENPALPCSPSREAYRRQLAEALNMNRTRILAFKSKAPTVADPFPKHFSSPVYQSKPPKPKRYIPQVCVNSTLTSIFCFFEEL